MNDIMNPNVVKDQFAIFDYKNLGSVRAYVDRQGEKWFCHLDVCNILGIANNRDAMSRLNPDGVGYTDVIDNLGRTQQATFINLGNLMELIFTSRKPEAKEFRSWVCQEVLPQLSTKGYYMMNNISIPEVLHGITGGMVEMNKTLNEHQQRLDNHQQMIENANHAIEVMEKEGYYTVASFARLKGIPIDLNDAKELGRRATDMCITLGLGVVPVPHKDLTYIHGYPYNILESVFADYFHFSN